jgi:ABC-type antimicrobial peptide transport system permease subunit
MNLALEGTDPSKAFSVKEHRVQDYYLETMQMQLVEGRDFRPDAVADNDGYIINETAAKMLGVENPVGERVMMWKRPGKIIGVIKNYHFASLRNNIEPLVISRYNPRMGNLTIRVDETNKAQTVEQIISIIKKHEPNYNPSYSYLEDILAKQYGSEERTFKLIMSASLIALILSMIGLYALSAYSLANRTKELGVRKILGASLSTLLKLLLADTTKWVLLASIIALPAGWYFAKDWLADFAFRIDIEPWVFISTILITYTIALLTVAGQVLHAARTNPVETLRYE